jgi:hypothetical protein
VREKWADFKQNHIDCFESMKKADFKFLMGEEKLNAAIFKEEFDDSKISFLSKNKEQKKSPLKVGEISRN